MEKRLRFGELVRNSGRPEAFTLWQDPAKDPRLKRAKRENRILTVLREPKKRDAGLIGFHERPLALYLVFPRPLPPEQGRHVIGINYQIMEQSEAFKGARTSEKPKARKPKLKPEKQKFDIKVRRTATVEDSVRVEALNRERAEEQAAELTMRRPFRAGRKDVRVEVVKE